MKRERRLLNGELLTVEVPGAQDLPPSQTFSVVMVDGVEVELNSGSERDLTHYLEVSGTTLTSESTLRGGERLRHGRWGGDPRGVLAFAVTVGEHEVYGFTPRADAESLAAWLSSVTWHADSTGPSLDLGSAGVEWSPYRTHTTAQTVVAPGSPGYLLDLRRARSDGFGGGKAQNSGQQVTGGLLSRSGQDEREAFVVLETPDVVCYGLPSVPEDLDTVATSLSQVTVAISGTPRSPA